MKSPARRCLSTARFTASYLWRSLDLIENDGACSEQRIGIALGLIEDTYVIESKIRPCWLNRPREGGLAGLPCAR